MSDDQGSSFHLPGISGGGHDTSLGGAGPGDRLELPAGALLAMRKSGGLRFSSRGLVIYRSGWAAPAPGDPPAPPRRVPPRQLDRLAGLLLRAGLPRLARRPPPRPAPDGFVYEVVARIGGRLWRAELSEGAIPPAAARLLRELGRHWPG